MNNDVEEIMTLYRKMLEEDETSYRIETSSLLNDWKKRDTAIEEAVAIMRRYVVNVPETQLYRLFRSTQNTFNLFQEIKAVSFYRGWGN